MNGEKEASGTKWEGSAHMLCENEIKTQDDLDELREVVGKQGQFIKIEH